MEGPDFDPTDESKVAKLGRLTCDTSPEIKTNFLEDILSYANLFGTPISRNILPGKSKLKLLRVTVQTEIRLLRNLYL